MANAAGRRAVLQPAVSQPPDHPASSLAVLGIASATPRQSQGTRAPMAIALPDSLSLDAVACGTQSMLDALVGLSPGFLQPAESLIGNDVVSLLRLQVSTDSVLRLGVRRPSLLGAVVFRTARAAAVDSSQGICEAASPQP